MLRRTAGLEQFSNWSDRSSVQAGRFNFILLVQARSPGTSYLQLTERGPPVGL